MSMINTLSIADYKMVNAKLARVLVSFTGKLSADDVASEVARMSGGRASCFGSVLARPHQRAARSDHAHQ